MPYLRTYNIFISHAWKYGDEYNRLVRFLDCAANFLYKNYSAPLDNPLHNLNGSPVTSKLQIMNAIDRKITPASCVLVISGMYYNYREWMQYELETAKRMNKPIIAIQPWGNIRMPAELYQYATTVVGWNTSSIVNAIRTYSL